MRQEILTGALLGTQIASAVVRGAEYVSAPEVTSYNNSPLNAQVEIYAHEFLPSELAVQGIEAILGKNRPEYGQHPLRTADESGLCPPPGYPYASDIYYLGSNDTDPVCTNNGLFANPLDNPKVCPNGMANAGKVYDENDPAGYVQCGTVTKQMPKSEPTQSPSTPPENGGDTTGNANIGDMPIAFLGLGTVAVLAMAAFSGKKKQ